MGPSKRLTKALFIWLFLIILLHKSIAQMKAKLQFCPSPVFLCVLIVCLFVCLFVLNFPSNTVRRLHVIWKGDFMLKHQFAPPTTQDTPFNTITQTTATDGLDISSFVRGKRGGGGSVNNFYVEILTEEDKTKLSTRRSKILYDKEANDFFCLLYNIF